MNTPRYDIRCAEFCRDGRGSPRPGTTWVHIYGRISWVCHPCAERLGRAAGLPTQAQVRRMRDQLERRLQTHMDEAYLEVCLAQPTPSGNDATPAEPGA